MHSTTVRQALTRRSLLASSWPWRALAYLLSGVALGAATLVVLVALVVVGTASAIVLVGVPLLLAAGLIGLPVAALERRRLRLVDADPIDDPHRAPGQVGLRVWLTTRFGEAATWRELAYTMVFSTVLWPVDLAVVVCTFAVPGSLLAAPIMRAIDPEHEVKVLKLVEITSTAGAWTAALIGVLALAAAMYVTTAYAAARTAVARALLSPRDVELARKLTEVTESRVRLVEAFDADRRRIERDLHDGAQQRLVALGMTLGLARLATPAELPGMLEQAHGQARLALDDLRDLVNGVHPPILRDRGLPAAVAEVADRSPIPVDVDLALRRRLPASIEATAYFVICEALTNVTKHSGATEARVSGHITGETLVVEVCDDGVGGADVARGTGLTGLIDRVGAAAGRLSLTSPDGGPTRLRVELPCGKPNRFA